MVSPDHLASLVFLVVAVRTADSVRTELLDGRETLGTMADLAILDPLVRRATSAILASRVWLVCLVLKELLDFQEPLA